MQDYLSAYRDVKNGKPDGITGFRWIQIFENLTGKKFVRYGRKEITLGQFIKKNPIGRFLIGTSGHALCVIDGVVYDTHPAGKRTYVSECLKL